MQCLKYIHATKEKVLQEVFCLWSTPCPLLGNGSLNTFPQKQMRGIEHLLLGNGAVNRMFSVGSVQSVYTKVEFQSWQFSSVVELSFVEGSAVEC
jgi:hypothetical protein